MKVALVLSAAVLALGVLWLAGEKHRENCIRENKIACSVLPWDNGHYEPVAAPTSTQPTTTNRFLQPSPSP